MLKAYRYRIYPNREQQEFFAKTFGSCRFIWNKMLEEKLKALENKEKIPQITPAKYKKEYPFLKEVDSLALANVQLQLEKAFKNFFKNKKHFGLPNFKKKKDKQSYTTNNQSTTVSIDIEKGLLYLPKIKSGIKIKLHRQFNGKIKSTTITKTKSGKYYVSVLVEEDNSIQPSYSNNLVCGIDVGIETFAVITNDKGTTKIEYPKYLIKVEKRLVRLQRQLSKKQKGSKNYEKTRQRLAKLHEYIKNSREDFLHKISKAIIDDNQVVVVEDLNVKGLLKTNLAKQITDSSWSKFIKYLSYKAQWYGRTIIYADKFYPSSKTCNICGYKNDRLTLCIRQWTCPICGTHHDRDENASINLYKIGLTQLTSGRVGTTRT